MAAATPGPRGAVRWLDALRLACAIGLAFAGSAAGARAADVPSTGALAAHGFDDAMSARVLAHEAEAHRQHVRIKLPGRVRLLDREGKAQEFDLIDISAGGMATRPIPAG